MSDGDTILVVGGAGYIGSHCLHELRRRGFKTLCYDNLSEGHRAACGETPLIVGSLNEEEKLDRLFAEHQVRAVFHFAANCYVGESVENPEKYYFNNVASTLVLLRAMRRAEVKRFIFSSTAATFGNPVRERIDESHPQEPINPYGRTKLMIEQILRDYGPAYGFSYCILRYFNAAGAVEGGAIGEDHDPETHLIPLVLKAAMGQRPDIKIFGTDYDTPDGTCVRDYIHILDLADAHIRGLEYLEKGGASTAFNLGNGSGYSVQQVIDTVEKVTGKAVVRSAAPRRAGDPAVLVADYKKASEVLGWKPRFGDLETIVRTAWEWASGHPEGYQDR
ncbi:MAG: UDP-glucose 4-epimerase GalE [Planctomycetes bacterium]|nr:UDP-glucose 4-epimerase GalE [Planctomycetota bacterium]